MNYSSRGNSSSNRRSQPPTVPEVASALDKYQVFEQWLVDNGAELEHLKLCEYESQDHQSNDVDNNNQGSPLFSEEKKEATSHHHIMPLTSTTTTKNSQSSASTESSSSELRGVHAKTHIAANHVCMSIPRQCLITVEMGQATPIGQAILHSDLDLDAPKHIFLMVYLLWDRKINREKR
jgi:hypothetical protein